MERLWGTVAQSAGNMDELVDPILESRVPIKRWLRPEEIGYMVSFLASPRAAGITGQFFVVDGGLDAHD